MRAADAACPRVEIARVVLTLEVALQLLLGELGEAPVVEHAVVQPVLVDGAQLVFQGLVQDIDDLFLAFHAASPMPRSPALCPSVIRACPPTARRRRPEPDR